MDERLYQFLKWTAISLALAWLGWSIYDSFVRERAPGDLEFHEGETLFTDGYFERALAKYDQALEIAPDHIYARRSRARTLLQLERYGEALREFDEVIARAPDFAPSYANRGILHDRLGNYPQAVADYEQALALDPELDEGPHWLTRFLRMQPDKPPTIGARARYLREQLAKPESERLLRVPEVDEQQRSYKQ